MNKHFEYHNNIRKNYIEFTKPYSEDQLHTIPEGFNNNIFWNVAHIIATQQSICYLIPNANPVVPIDFIKEFRRGTSPKEDHQKKYSYKLLIEYLHLTSQKIVLDYPKLKELNYKPFTTQFGATFENIDEAIIFNNIHESIHFGYVLSLKHALK